MICITETLLPFRRKMFVVLVFRKPVCVLVAILVVAPPLLACALPGMRLNAEEMACCRHMADQCGDASMPESHSCCKKKISAQAGAFQIKQRDPVSVDVVGQVPGPDIFVAPIVDAKAPAHGVLVFSESPPGHSSVLRI
ncbi:MAG TPA: hypothetical protein VFL42_11735 [Terriglobales bacterium]|nr:hypothetical protein [Terriglobales bacterium]